MFFGYLEYEKIRYGKCAEGKRKGLQGRALAWQVVSGIGLGLAVISKYNSVYVVITLALYSLIKRRWNIIDSVRDLFLVYLVGFVLFLCYVLLGIVASPENWLDFIWVIGFNRYYGSKMYFLAGSMYFLWSTLLLFGFYVWGWFRRSKEILLLLIWITMPLLFYTLILSFGSMDRYFMNTIPALCILGGICIAEMQLSRKYNWFIGMGGLLMMLVYFVINSLDHVWMPRFPELYAKELLSGNLHFLFSYTSAAGPTFGVNFATIFWSILLGGGFLALFVVFMMREWKVNYIQKPRNTKAVTSARLMLCGFLIVGVGFNLFLIGEYLFHPTGVDVSEVKWEMMEYVDEMGLVGPYYTNDQGIEWYYDNMYWGESYLTEGFGDNELGSDTTQVLNKIFLDEGTILLLHWPPLHHNSPAREVVDACLIKKNFYSKEILMGEVYTC